MDFLAEGGGRTESPSGVKMKHTKKQNTLTEINNLRIIPGLNTTKQTPVQPLLTCISDNNMKNTLGYFRDVPIVRL